MKRLDCKQVYHIEALQNNDDLDRLLSLIWVNSLYNEEWREIKHTQGLNFISNYGRVVSIRMNGAKILQPYICGDGYYCVSIRYDGDSKFTDARINILVAKAFIPNPNNKPLVHHKDGNKLNNNVSNLQWLTSSEHAEAHKTLNRYQKKEETTNETLLSSI